MKNGGNSAARWKNLVEKRTREDKDTLKVVTACKAFTMLMVLQECLLIPLPRVATHPSRDDCSVVVLLSCFKAKTREKSSTAERCKWYHFPHRFSTRETFSGPSGLDEMRRCSIMVLWKEGKKITKFCLRKVIKNNLDFKYEQHFCERIENEIGNFYQFRTLFWFCAFALSWELIRNRVPRG